MEEIVDIAIIGGGPAGLSGAINAHARNKSVTVFSGNYQESGLYKAEKLDNYLGVPGATGADFLEQCRRQVEAYGIRTVEGRILNIMPMGDIFLISCGSEVYSSRTVILASGIVMLPSYPGEKELLGRGVSYCATCDGMIYRGRRVSVVAKSGEAVHDANFLKQIGCDVTVITDGREISGLSPGIRVIAGKKIEIVGDNKVEALIVDTVAVPCDAVFILRNSIAMSTLLPNVELDNGHIKTEPDMSTSIPGVYAAGDCTGRPYQVAKAVGEGQIAALAAAEYVDNREETN